MKWEEPCGHVTFVRFALHNVNASSSQLATMSGGFTVCVMVDNTRKMLHGLNHNATVGDVIKKLKAAYSKERPQVLLESWNGCYRVMPHEEKLCTSFEQWGSQVRDVKLVMTGASRQSPREWQKRGRGCVGKIATRKRARNDHRLRNVVRCSQRRRRRLQMQELEWEIVRLRDELAYQEFIERALSNHAMDSTDRMRLSAFLPPELKGEFLEVRRFIEEQQQRTAELLQHRAELRKRIVTRHNEKLALERTVEELQNKVRSRASKN